MSRGFLPLKHWWCFIHGIKKWPYLIRRVKVVNLRAQSFAQLREVACMSRQWSGSPPIQIRVRVHIYSCHNSLWKKSMSRICEYKYICLYSYLCSYIYIYPYLYVQYVAPKNVCVYIYIFIFVYIYIYIYLCYHCVSRTYTHIVYV